MWPYFYNLKVVRATGDARESPVLMHHIQLGIFHTIFYGRYFRIVHLDLNGIYSELSQVN
jgi:hypothetical protein